MSEARLHSPDPRTPRPMAGWAASLRDSGLLALAVPRVFAGMERDWGKSSLASATWPSRNSSWHGAWPCIICRSLPFACWVVLNSSAACCRPASSVAGCGARRSIWWRAQPEAQEHWRGGFLVGGRGSDCFAVEDVDRLLISAWHAPSRAHLIAVAETGRAGIDISGLADGSGLFLPAGQRLHYQRLRLHPEDILVPPGLPPTPCGQLREGLTRLAQANLDLGQAARVPGEVAGQGEAPRLLALALRLVELAAESFQAAFARGGALTFRESAAASLLASEAEAVARAGLLACLRRQALEARLLGAAL